MDLEEVRWKLAEELTPEEADFLKENKDNLNEEELNAFQEVLKDPEEEVVEEAPEETPEDNSTEGEPEEEKKPDAQFLTRDEAQDFVTKALEDRKGAEADANKGTEEEKAAKKELLKLFDDGYKAQDANEFANKLLEIFTPILTKNTIDTISQMNQKQRQELADSNSKLDDQYKELAKKNNLPDLATDEGQKLDTALASLASKYGMDNYYDAFDLYSKIPQKFGGGLTLEAEEDNKKKEVGKSQRKAAGMVSGGSGEGAAKSRNDGPSREDIATNDMDTLLARAQS